MSNPANVVLTRNNSIRFDHHTGILCLISAAKSALKTEVAARSSSSSSSSEVLALQPPLLETTVVE